jgi:hypothetical protein
MARLLLVPVLSLAVQSAVEDVPFILSLNEDVLIRISSVVIGSLFVWIKLLKTEIQPEAESRGSRLYRNPGIMFFILIFCIGIPLLTAGWFGVSIFEYFFETTGGFNIDFIILTVPFFVAVADNTYVVQRSFSGFIERGAEF